jgi:hypothetical protein
VRRRQRHRKYAVGASFVSGKPERAAEIVVLIAEIVVGLAIGAEERTVLPATSRQPMTGSFAVLLRRYADSPRADKTLPTSAVANALRADVKRCFKRLIPSITGRSAAV